MSLELAIIQAELPDQTVCDFLKVIHVSCSYKLH